MDEDKTLPLSLMGGSMKFTMKRKITDSYANAAIKKTITGMTDNTCEVILLPADTALLEPDIYVMDFTFTDAAGNVLVPQTWEIPLEIGVTNG